MNYRNIIKFFSSIKNKKKLSRFKINDMKRAIAFFVIAARKHTKERNSKNIIIVGKNNLYKKGLLSKIKRESYSIHSVNDYSELAKIKDKNNIACIIMTQQNESELAIVASKLIASRILSVIPFEYISLPQLEYKMAIDQDSHQSFSFISPLLVSKVDYLNIYEKSLDIFIKTCQVRDYMDLCQLIESVISRKIGGDIAEFGSFRGHSGYLISEILNALKSRKKLFMFDTFSNFPEEKLGIDSFWSRTHETSFKQIKEKFKSKKNVNLIRGDFTKTFKNTNIKKLSMVYVDCDSYRGTKYLLENIYDKVLSKGGIMIIEDYGHAPLLGNRIAYHKFFNKKKDCLKFFSQFSGFQIIFKPQ